MPENDPTDTGGLFIGRRPGTAPLRYREQPVTRRAAPAALRQRPRRARSSCSRRWCCATLWGPQPAGWLWVGSQVDYQTGSVVLGILIAFAGMLATIMGRSRSRCASTAPGSWCAAPPATSRRSGMLERIFVISMVVGGTAFAIWLLVIQGPGSESLGAAA